MRGRRGVGSVDALNQSSSGGTGGGMGAPHLLVIGAAFFGFFLICLMTQVETNEAFINGSTSIDVYRPNWSVFLQVPYLILGWLPPSQVTGVIFGWGIELVYLAFTIAGIELIHHSVHQAGRILGIVFEVLSFGAVAFNWYSDFNYGTISPAASWGHFWFACMTAFVVGYFGNIGIYLMRWGWSRA